MPDEQPATPDQGSTAPEDERRPRWLIPVLTTLVGVVATMLVGVYQVRVAQEQAHEAERERTKSVVNSIVSIIEEHILNEKNLDLPRIVRLVESRSREEGLAAPPPVLGLLEKAEFNIMESRYLTFERKEGFKKVFDDIYGRFQETKLDYEGAHADIASDVAANIRDGHAQDGLAKLRLLLGAFNADIEDLRNQIRPRPALLDVLLSIVRAPWALATLAFFYLVLIGSIYTNRARRRRWRREREYRMRQDLERYGRRTIPTRGGEN